MISPLPIAYGVHAFHDVTETTRQFDPISLIDCSPEVHRLHEGRFNCMACRQHGNRFYRVMFGKLMGAVCVPCVGDFPTHLRV